MTYIGLSLLQICRMLLWIFSFLFNLLLNMICRCRSLRLPWRRRENLSGIYDFSDGIKMISLNKTFNRIKCAKVSVVIPFVFTVWVLRTVMVGLVHFAACMVLKVSLTMELFFTGKILFNKSLHYIILCNIFTMHIRYEVRRAEDFHMRMPSLQSGKMLFVISLFIYI